MTSTSLKSLGSRGASIVSLDYTSATPSKKWTASAKALERRQDSLTTSTTIKSTSLIEEKQPLAFSKIQSDQTSASKEAIEVIQPQPTPPPESEPQPVKDKGLKQKLKCGKCEIL